MSAPRPRVVIAGAGFAGLAAAKALRRVPVRVTVVDRNDYHTFTPFLYQVATALLDVDAAAYPVRGEIRRLGTVSFRLATVTGIDLGAKAVETDRGRLPYDYLVPAAGAVNAYFDHAEIAERSLGLNDLPEAMQLRNTILARFEDAAWASDHPVRLIAEPVLPSNQIPATAANPAGPAGTGGGQLALSPGHGTPKHGAAARLRHRKEQR